MQTVLDFFQSYFVHQAFLVALFLITLYNLNNEVKIKIPLQIIRYILILSGITSIVGIFISQFITPHDPRNDFNFINRASGPYKVISIITLVFSILLPLILLIKKYGMNKYLILIFSFLVSLGFYFERFVIYVTSNHRGHLNEGMNLQINDFSIRVAIIIALLTINLLLFILKKSKTDTDKSEIDSEFIK